MVSTPVLIQDISDAASAQSGSFVRLPKIAAPFTTVVGRALMTDLSKDLMPRFGIERIPTQRLIELPEEVGPAGERVFKPVNDFHDQIRIYGFTPVNYVGDGSAFANNSGTMEVSFYGTGLNIFMSDSGSRSIQAAVDGGALGSNFWPSPVPNIPSAAHNFNPAFTLAVPGATNLTLGFHTVKFVVGPGIFFYGFEILNTGTSLQWTPGSSFNGGKKLTKTTLTTDAYDSNFESGTLPGAPHRGGRVVVYQKSDGSIGKAVQPTDTTQLNLGAANHTNEEVVRAYNYREFGAGHSSDFSVMPLTTLVTRAFTLDDGTTNLHGNNVTSDTSTNGALDFITTGTNTRWFIFTFVGTGLDVLADRLNQGASAQCDIFIDGVSVGATQSLTDPFIQKIVSGLPYGTHSVKFQLTNGSPASWGVSRFIVYGPKKPTIPTGAVELADYNLMASFVANTTVGIENRATGVLRKATHREVLFQGTWTMSAPNALYLGGYEMASNANPKAASITFFGTGFDLRFSSATNRTTAATVTLNGVSLNNAYPSAGSITCSITGTGISYGGQTGSFLLSTVGVSPAFDMSDAAAQEGLSFRVSGLPLGQYVLKISDATTGFICINAVDVVTPVHSPKYNEPSSYASQSLPIGSSAIGDLRVFSTQNVDDIPNWAQTFGVSVDPTTTVNSLIPMPQMAVTIRTSGKPVQIGYSVDVGSAGPAAIAFAVFMDGIQVSRLHYVLPSGNGVLVEVDNVADTLIVTPGPGTHTIELKWRTVSGTATGLNDQRNLWAKEML